MKILVTGGEGLLGTRLCKFLSKEHEVISADINILNMERDYEVIKLDITNKNEVEEKLNKIKPDVVVHAAALTNVDFCEKNHEKADLINIKGTENIVNSCKEINSKILFVSSEFVFDGKNGPYDEKAEPNPINYYGETKKKAEEIVKESRLKFLIVRTTVLYGEHKNKMSYVSWVIKNLKEGKKIRIVTDQHTTPTWVKDLAQAIVFLINKDYFKNEIVHTVGKDRLNRYDFTLKIAEVFGLDKKLIIPITSDELENAAARPKNAGMKTDKLKNLGYETMGIEESLERIKNGEDKL